MSIIDPAKIKETAGAVVDTVLAAKRSAEDLGHSLSTKIEKAKSHSADTLQSGAESVRKAASVDPPLRRPLQENSMRRLRTFVNSILAPWPRTCVRL